MEKDIIEEIVKECENWKERLLVRLFPNLFIKVYNEVRIEIVNILLK